MACKPSSRSTNTWLPCARKGLFFFFLLGSATLPCVLWRCATPVLFGAHRLLHREAGEGSGSAVIPCGPEATERVSTGSSVSHTLLLAAGFLRLLPALALVSLVWRQFGYWNWEKTNLTVNRILSCQAGELQQCGRGARAPSRQGGEACGRESGGGTQGQEEAEEAGSPSPKSFLLSCVTSPWDTEHRLHGSSISSCLLNKWVILRPSLSLKGTHINQIFFNRSFVVDTGAYLVHGKERPGSWLGLLGGTV